MTKRTTHRLMLAFLENDAGSVDSVERILSEVDDDGVLDIVLTLLALLFPVGAHDGRAAWEQWLQDGIAGHRIDAVPDHVPDFGADQ